MKPNRQYVTRHSALLLMLILLLAGCTSTGMERSDEATTTMQTVENDIQHIVVQLDATGQSLDNLVAPGQSAGFQEEGKQTAPATSLSVD